MASLNKAILIGNVGQDPKAISQKSVTFTLATSDRYKDKDGNPQERTEWHRVTVFNEKISEYIIKHVKKGSKIYVEGKITYNKYLDKDGQEKISCDIQVTPFKGEVKLLSPVESGSDSSSSSSSTMQQFTSKMDQYNKPSDIKRSMKDLYDDSVPF